VSEEQYKAWKEMDANRSTGISIILAADMKSHWRCVFLGREKTIHPCIT